MRKRNIKKNFWFNTEEDEQLKKLSTLLKLSEANTIRKILFETNIKEAPPREFYVAIDKINKIGVNINQLTHIANSSGDIYIKELDVNFNRLEMLIQELKSKYL